MNEYNLIINTCAGTVEPTDIVKYHDLMPVEVLTPTKADIKSLRYSNWIYNEFRAKSTVLVKYHHGPLDFLKELETNEGIQRMEMPKSATIFEILEEMAIKSSEQMGVPAYYISCPDHMILLPKPDKDHIVRFKQYDENDCFWYHKVVMFKPQTFVVCKLLNVIEEKVA